MNFKRFNCFANVLHFCFALFRNFIAMFCSSLDLLFARRIVAFWNDMQMQWASKASLTFQGVTLRNSGWLVGRRRTLKAAHLSAKDLYPEAEVAPIHFWIAAVSMPTRSFKFRNSQIDLYFRLFLILSMQLTQNPYESDLFVFHEYNYETYKISGINIRQKCIYKYSRNIKLFISIRQKVYKYFCLSK